MTGFMCGVPVRAARRIETCPYCGIEGWTVTRLQSSPYYSPAVTCTNCGDTWCWDEGLWERPFRRGWRQQSIAQAIATWEACCDCPEVRDVDGYLTPCPHQSRTSGCIPLVTQGVQP